MTEALCVACGSARLTPHLRVRGGTGEAGLIPSTDAFGTALGNIVRCADCGHGQLDAFPDEAELEGAYGAAASEDYVEEEAGQRETARRALARIAAHAPGAGDGPHRPRRLLDLGCWVGFLLAEAQAAGWEGVGVEPSAWASAYARDRLGLDVRTEELFTAALPASAWDAVVLGDVIEHLPRPAAALARVRELLAPGGVLWMALPDAGSLLARAMGRRWWSVIPTHVQYFTRESIAALLAREGWEVLEIRTHPKVFTVRYYLSRVEGYSPALGRALVRAAERAGVADRMWGPDFRDRVAVIARPR